MNSKIISALTLSILLIGCSDSEQTQPQETTDVAAESSTDVAPQASVDTVAEESQTKSLGDWQVWESRDPMTDELSKDYTLVSNESPNNKIKLECFEGDLKFLLSFYSDYEYLVKEYLAKGLMRVDNGQVVEHEMGSAYYRGTNNMIAYINNPRSFYEKIKGGSLLAFSYEDGATTFTKNTYNIAGVEYAVADMEEIGCKFKE